MEQSKREKLLTVKKEMEGFMKESVPFWLENGIDKEYGGYLVCFDSKGKLMKELAVLTPEDKMIVTQTRMIWGFSALLRNGLAKRYGWEEKCKEAAKQGVDFFIDKFWDKKNTGWAWVTDRKGNVLDNGKLVYGQTFAWLDFGNGTGCSGCRYRNLCQFFCCRIRKYCTVSTNN